MSTQHREPPLTEAQKAMLDEAAGWLSPRPAGSAWDRLVAFLCDDSDITPEQVRADLEADGVDVDAFLARIQDTIRQHTQNNSVSHEADAGGRVG